MGMFKDLSIKKMEENEKVGAYCIEKLSIAETLAMTVTRWYDRHLTAEKQQHLWETASKIREQLGIIRDEFEKMDFERDDLNFFLSDEVESEIRGIIRGIGRSPTKTLSAAFQIAGQIVRNLIYEQSSDAFDAIDIFEDCFEEMKNALSNLKVWFE